ncbi:hypothetical protein Tco_0184694 [Tanacetum coccineum]
MKEQIARLKPEVEWAAQEAASSQNTFKDFLAHFNRQQSQAGCSSYTPLPMYTPQAVLDGSGSSSRRSSQSSQDYCSQEEVADMMREYEVEITITSQIPCDDKDKDEDKDEDEDEDEDEDADGDSLS